MELTTSTVLTVGGYLVSFGTIFGMVKSELKILTKQIDRLEEKQDKHNGLIERMVIVEQATKSAHRRIDEECEKISEFEKEVRSEMANK